ncbi:hypothetical protein SKAU_G00401080 [Synaphobranchus kaupii]|uniref:Hyaluronan synthase 2 n=1 Tax=Synaphobranchus kaupii TaxID=118154 RepID=A0A9Q1ICC0_SYNKA|nr:hypothetical protein SKAU_G00401080 [Synaphobranchus kaupii]
MYTAFKAMGSSVDYLQACDSDTVLDPASSVEMKRVLEDDPMAGGVGGYVESSLLLKFLEDWYSRAIMGSHCNFWDDHHLTDRALSLGYATKYTNRSRCLTEAPPATYFCWLNQQTRWCKSYFSEWRMAKRHVFP